MKTETIVLSLVLQTQERFAVYEQTSFNVTIWLRISNFSMSFSCDVLQKNLERLISSLVKTRGGFLGSFVSNLSFVDVKVSYKKDSVPAHNMSSKYVLDGRKRRSPTLEKAKNDRLLFYSFPSH